MVKPNKHFQSLNKTYLFQEIEKRVFHFKNLNPTLPVYNLGIGDIAEPMASFIIDAICRATEELKEEKTFKGYGPAEGYDFLRRAIAQNDYANLGIDEDEVFIVNGSKDAISNFQELFATSNTIGMMDPTYPVYFDSNVIGGRGSNIMFFSCLEENNFIPQLPEKSCDIIYLCSPNNPTGMSFSYNQLKSWVDFAKERNAIIFYDGAYSSFITSDVPRSIFEIPDAKDVCIEFRSFSKMAGFTNLRCSYVIIPKNIDIEGFNLRELWKRRIGAKFGGVPYPIQRGAHILYTSEGQNEIKSKMASYHLRAAFILQMLRDLNFTVYGGIDAPYVWCKTPHGMSSFTFFDYLLEKAQIVGVPGSGFGKGGEGFIRFSAFQHQVYIEKAFANIKRIKT